MTEAAKQCCKCKQYKRLECFGKLASTKDGLRYDCSDCRKEYRDKNKEHIKQKNQEYFAKNKEELLLKNKAYREANKDTIFLQRQQYRQKNQEHIKQKQQEYKPRRALLVRLKRQTDVGFRLEQNMRTRMHYALRSLTMSKTLMIQMHCNISILTKWLEFQFDKNMTWDNMGTYWEVDHILPIAAFDLTQPYDREVCFNWTNLQPLEKTENKNKWDYILLHYYFNSIVSVHRFTQSSNENTFGYQSINKSLCWLRNKLRYGENPDE